MKAQIKLKSGRLILLAIFLLGLVIGLSGGYFISFTTDTPELEQGLVVRVIDGDTVELADGQRIRYLGIDTPELSEPYSQRALAKNKELVEGKTIELQQGERDRDEFGRFLRYVYVNGVFVNAQLVSQGLAKAYVFDPDEKFSQVLVQLEQYAKLKKQGLWSTNESRKEN